MKRFWTAMVAGLMVMVLAVAVCPGGVGAAPDVGRSTLDVQRFPTVEGCVPALCLDGCYFTEGVATGHRFAFWLPLENDARFGVLGAYNDGGQFLGWCLLAGGSDYHLATAAELAPLGKFVPGWRDARGIVQAEIPPAVRKMLGKKRLET